MFVSILIGGLTAYCLILAMVSNYLSNRKLSNYAMICFLIGVAITSYSLGII